MIYTTEYTEPWPPLVPQIENMPRGNACDGRVHLQTNEGLPFTFRVGPSWPASSRKRLIFCSGVVKTAGDCDCFGGKWTVNHRISNHRKSKEERAKIHQASVGRDVIYFLFQFFRFFLFKENGYDQMIFKNITTIIYFKRILFSNI
jgi:hypothetical protein